MHPKALLKRTFHLVGILAWIVGLCLALELYAAARWWWIESRNPLVAAYNKSASTWPRVDIDSSAVPSSEQVDIIAQAGRTPPPQPQADSEDHLGSRLAQMNEDDRHTYAALNDTALFLYDREGANIGTYASRESVGTLGLKMEDVQGKPFTETPLAVSSSEGLQAIRRVIDTAKPETSVYALSTPGGQQQVEMSCFPVKDPGGKVSAALVSWRNVSGLPLTESLAREKNIEKNPMWKRLWFEYRKNAHISAAWYTNNAGFRDDDVVLPKPAGTFRIVCTGGSTTEEGLTNSLTYPNILEKKLRAHFEGKLAVEVINCGVVGLDLSNERKRTLDYARLDPDLVLDYNAVNDICHGLFQRLEGSMPKSRQILGSSRFIVRYCNALLWPGTQELSRDIDQFMTANIRTVHDVYARHGIPMAVCGFASPDPALLCRAERDFFEYNIRTYWQGRHFSFETYRRLVGLYNAQVQAFCESNGMLYIPLDKEFSGTSREFGDICHMRPKGIERKADIVCAHLIPYIEKALAEGNGGAGKKN